MNDMIELRGFSLVAGEPAEPGGTRFRATNPATGDSLEPSYSELSLPDLDLACRRATEAWAAFRRSDGSTRAGLLRRIATEIEALGAQLIDRFVAETALPPQRALGERERTCAQLRMFADVAVGGSWADPRVDHALPDRKPAPRADIRSMLVPIGPVAVFGPANFPLAFSVAGGDTASAFAAGCPVIVKAHSSHPGTSELVGHAIVRAIRALGLPPGVFSLVFGGGQRIGAALASHPAIKAVGFTGSYAAGRHLFDLCAGRPEPIPFFGELSSLNPVVLLPDSLPRNLESIANGLHASVTQGVGQFCTNPGLVLIPAGVTGEQFAERLAHLMRTTAPAAMLNKATGQGYRDGIGRLGRVPGVEMLVGPASATTSFKYAGHAALFRVSAVNFLAQPSLHEEVFGPATLLVTCSRAEITQILQAVRGQLTVTIHGDENELMDAQDIIELAGEKAGRIIFNGFPTGVEVCSSMVHSGPWPAATDSRFTSVGTSAIYRWARPVCWQNAPEACLPPALRDGSVRNS